MSKNSLFYAYSSFIRELAAPNYKEKYLFIGAFVSHLL